MWWMVPQQPSWTKRWKPHILRIIDQKIGAWVSPWGFSKEAWDSLSYLALHRREIAANLFKPFLFGLFCWFYVANLTACLLYKFLVVLLSRKTISGDKLKITPINLSKLLDKKVIQDKSTSTISMFFSEKKGRHFSALNHTGFSMGCFCSQIPKHKAVHSLKINQ